MKRPDGTVVRIYAAGSLRNVIPALSGAFLTKTGIVVETRHGPAGLLREHIEAGERPDLFLSANFSHPQRLAELDLAGPPVIFARNAVAAIARKDAGITTSNFIDRLLDPNIVVATSTPVKDPSGDYAWEIFREIGQIRPGAFAVLDAKAKKLVGAGEPTAAPGNYDAIAQALKTGAASLFLGYVTGLQSLAAELKETEIIEIPHGVNVVPEYALAALKDCSAAALSFALFVLSADGQLLLRDFGFQPVALPQSV